jgi:hypothetical protein
MNLVEMPTFNVITATPTNSISRFSPEHESVINNNNIIIQTAVVSEAEEGDPKLQKPSDNFEDTCATDTCPEKPKLM